ncbi:hypothetical protein D3C80_908110 [compost metagenome]
MRTLKLKPDAPAWLVSIIAALGALGTYTFMYAYRKSFTAGTFEGLQFLDIDYKVWLVFAQIIGYATSKFYGIRYIAEVKPESRIKKIIACIVIAWIALLGFALIPAPYNIPFLLINGFPLGMVWGLVFSFLEGRKTTEVLGAILASSLIFASGLVKSVGRWMLSLPVSEFWMPFLVGALFFVPLIISLFLLHLLPPPTAEDKALRSDRGPMNKTQRKDFLKEFLPGIVITVFVYMILTVIRDVRDNFEVEIWHWLGVTDYNIFVWVDGCITIAVLLLVAFLFLVKKNLRALNIIHLFVIGGSLLTGLSTLLFLNGEANPVWWMITVSFGLFLSYIPYNAIFFDRLIAAFKVKGNVGFLIYIADSVGYLGSVSVLTWKEFGAGSINWGQFFIQAIIVFSVIGFIAGLASMLYFNHKYQRNKKEDSDLFNNMHHAKVEAELL